MEEGLAVDGKPGMTMDISDLTYGILGANKKVKRLLKRVNLSLSSPSMCALMGPSGAGKRLFFYIHFYFFKTHYWSIHLPV